jgi:hypothetical protein
VSKNPSSDCLPKAKLCLERRYELPAWLPQPRLMVYIPDSCVNSSQTLLHISPPTLKIVTEARDSRSGSCVRELDQLCGLGNKSLDFSGIKTKKKDNSEISVDISGIELARLDGASPGGSRTSKRIVRCAEN